MYLSTKFGKEIPSRNLREKGSDDVPDYELVRKGGKDPLNPQDFSLTKKTARFTKDQFCPY